MGERINVIVDDGTSRPTFLYSHWGGGRMVGTITRALDQCERWDTDYFTRIIHARMVADAVADVSNGELRYGFDLLDDVTDPAERTQVCEALVAEFRTQTGNGIGTEHGDQNYSDLILNPRERTLTIVEDNLTLTFEEVRSLRPLTWGDLAAIKNDRSIPIGEDI